MQSGFQLKGYAVYTLEGKQVLQALELADKKLSIDVSTLPKGMYILELEGVQGWRHVRRFVKSD